MLPQRERLPDPDQPVSAGNVHKQRLRRREQARQQHLQPWLYFGRELHGRCLLGWYIDLLYNWHEHLLLCGYHEPARGVQAATRGHVLEQ
jgi:hypothetical protein